LYYENRWEFVEALRLLTRDPALRSALGQNGRAYINRNYRWDIILSKYERMMARLRPVQRDPREARDGRDHRQGDRRPKGPQGHAGSARPDRRPSGRSEGRPDGRSGGKPEGRRGDRPDGRSGRSGDRRPRSR
jgi:hypothetical protein